MPTPKRLPYSVFEFDLSKARTDEKFTLPRGANWIRVLYIDGTLTIRLNREDADKIEISNAQAYCYSEEELIYEIYITNTAQAGKKVVFAAGTKDVDISPGG